MKEVRIEIKELWNIVLAINASSRVSGDVSLSESTSFHIVELGNLTFLTDCQ